MTSVICTPVYFSKEKLRGVQMREVIIKENKYFVDYKWPKKGLQINFMKKEVNFNGTKQHRQSFFQLCEKLIQTQNIWLALSMLFQFSYLG